MLCSSYTIQRCWPGWLAPARGRDMRMPGPSKAAREDILVTDLIRPLKEVKAVSVLIKPKKEKHEPSNRAQT